MSTVSRQTRFQLNLMGSDQPFSVLAFKGEEAISEPFSFDIQLVSEQASLDLE
ncbi:type VI secretion system tip protein VgrG, partial [Pseudomonas lundensis]|nr:type VI secretion system tip protein VgrG [Pseudomonas lundensis]NNA19077.1 type VI secretion system tip protein VgrG [Pseudomonas lundensis]